MDDIINSLIENLRIVRNRADQRLSIESDVRTFQKLEIIRNKLDEINFIINLINAGAKPVAGNPSVLGEEE